MSSTALLHARRLGLRFRSSLRSPRRATLLPLLVVALAGVSCAIHPHGEQAERELAGRAYGEPGSAGGPGAGTRTEEAWAVVEPSPLAPDASLGAILEYAYAASPKLRGLYWEWVAAIEAIPQEASPGTNLSISLESMFEDGKTSLARTTLGIGNDPMSSIPWPGKLSTAGKRAVEMARAAGRRFEGGKLEVRTRVLGAYYDYALVAESMRLKEVEVALLETVVETARARVRAGASSAADMLGAFTERDLAASELETLRSQAPGRRAELNALLGRDPEAPIDPPAALPQPRELPYSDAEILALVAERNPEIAALAHESRANREAVKMARQQYIPDLGLTLKGDLEGLAQSIMGMLTAPVVRHEAIAASIRQARAELEASEALRREAAGDIKASAILALYDLRDTERQVKLFEGTVVPRLEETVALARADYVAGRAAIPDLVEIQRMLLDARLTVATMRMERERLLARIEQLAGGEN
jgi:cobalt-zinc-cadmium efflux system outer membrane protein